MAVDLAESGTAGADPDALTLRRVFESVTAESCPRCFNFHMHTLCSDGRLTPERLIEQAVQLGLQGLAITDHHSVKGYYRARQWLNNWQTGQQADRLKQSSQAQRRDNQSFDRAMPQLWTGIEVNADLLNDEVHILGYAFNPDAAAMQPYLRGETTTGTDYQAAQVIAAIHQAGGLAVLAHPARYRRSPDQLIPAAAELGIDGIETYYAYNNPLPWQPSPKQTREVGRLGKRYALLHTCGTDTHGLSLLQRL